MRKIIMAINVTPDGFCDHRPVIADGALHHFYSDLLADADTILFGRKTFQLMDPYWATVARNKTGTPEEIEFAERIDAIDKIVFSRKGIETSWQPTTVLKELIPGEMESLKSAPGKNILVGSPSIIDQLAGFGLIDEYHFVVQPMIAGSGKRFFDSTQIDHHVLLVLQHTKRFASGVIDLCYAAQR
jgi:dihydrofolate reductase